MPTKIKKESATKAPAKKVVKKTAKKVAKKSPAKKAPAKRVALEIASEPTKPIQKVIYRFEKRFAFVPNCTNCGHVPMRINKLVALMTILVAILSGVVLAQQQPVAIDRVLVNAVNAMSQKS